MIGPEPAGSERLPATHPGVGNDIVGRLGDQSGEVFPGGSANGGPPGGPMETPETAVSKSAFGYNKVILVSPERQKTENRYT